MTPPACATFPVSGAMELAPAAGRPRLRLEWNEERTRLLRDRLEIYAFDPAGRPMSWVRQGYTYRRGLDGTTVEIVRVGEGGDEDKYHLTRRLAPEEIEVQLGHVRGAVEQGWEAFGQPEPLRLAYGTVPQQVAREFRSIWRPVMILPPDQYRSLVLQLTEGCSYNQCSFCTFYKDRPFRARSMEEFRSHLEEAVAFLREGLSWRRGIFLADANAANLPDDQITAALEYLRERFPAVRAGGRLHHPCDFHRVSSFLDTFSAVRRTTERWKHLAGLGLDSLYLGVETGSNRVLKMLRKPGSSGQVERLVHTLKEAGLRVGVIVMTGVGGRDLADEHVEETAALVNRLPLDAGDRIYLSEFEPDPKSPYVQAELAELMDRAACRAQSREIKARLRFPRYPAGPVVSPYDVRQFVY